MGALRETHRFETVLSGSPVIIPAGTHTLHISFELARGRHDKTILLSTMASRFYLDAANPTDNSNNNNVFMTIGYVPSVRRLTYGAPVYGSNSVDADDYEIRAIGE